MSELRVALIAEGPTDAIIIQAALKALLPCSFVLTQLQPEATQPKLGSGWGGVLRWCLDFARRGHARFEDDPTLPGYDLFVVHADADVADQSYANVSTEIAAIARERGWPPLPNIVPCPPPVGAADVVRSCLSSWAGLHELGPKTVLCIPSKSIDAWLATATFDETHALLVGLECNPNLERQLAALPLGQRIKKTMREYRARESAITSAWPMVQQRCSQAARFSTEVAAVSDQIRPSS